MDAGSPANAEREDTKAAPFPAAVGVVLLIVLLVVVRAYRLDTQSVWWDDYNGLVGLRASDLRSSLELARGVNPDAVPLYYIVQYGFSRVLGTSPVVIRALSILFAVLTLPLVYLLGRDIYGKTAGLVGALCFSLSPIHVYHDQSMRPYPLLALLAACSAYALLRALRTGRVGWWGLNLLANFLVVWTHVFGVFLLLAEGMLLVLLSRRRWGAAVIWISTHCLLLVPTVLWISSRPEVPIGGYHHFRAPTSHQVLYDWLGDDAIGTGYQLLTSRETWSFLSPRCRGFLFAHGRTVDRAIVWVFGLCLAWLVLRMPCLLWRAYRSKGRGQAPRKFEDALLLLMVSTVPVLALSLLSHVWRPCIYPRYTLYCSIALFVIVGGAVQHVPFRFLKTLGVMVLVALYGWQLSFVLPASVRTDWMGAAAHIKSGASPQDMILIGGLGPAYPNVSLFCFNMGPTEVPIAPAHTLQAVCDKSVCFLARPGLPSDVQPTVWFVLNRLYYWASLENLDECLTARGLTFECKQFPAMEKLTVYRITRRPDFDAACEAPTDVIVHTDVDYRGMLRDYGVSYSAPDAEDRAVALLRRIHDDGVLPAEAHRFDFVSEYLLEEGAYDLVLAGARHDLEVHPGSANAYRIVSHALLNQGDLEGATEAARQAVELAPHSPLCHLAMALALFKGGDPDGSMTAFRRALACDDGAVGPLEPVLVAMYGKDYDRARTEAYRLRSENAFVPRSVLT